MAINRRQFLAATAATVAASTFDFSPVLGAESKSRPNILMIISDQLNAFTLGVAGCDIQTPHIDRLAKEGCRFENACTTYPLCVPWRSSMASGLYPHQFGLHGNNGGGTAAKDRDNFARATGGKTIYSLLHEAGYDSRFVGKWHMTIDPDKPDLSGVLNQTVNASRDSIVRVSETILRDHKGDKPLFLTGPWHFGRAVLRVQCPWWLRIDSWRIPCPLEVRARRLARSF